VPISMSQPILLTATTTTGRGAESELSRMREITGESFYLGFGLVTGCLALSRTRNSRKCA